MHSESSPRFIASTEEYSKVIDNAPADAYLLWADTENVQTQVRTVESSPYARTGQLDTAFTVLHKTDAHGVADNFHQVLDNCEAIAWQLLRRMDEQANPINGGCGETDILRVDLNSARVFRDGPYAHAFWGVTCRLSLKMRNAIPAYNEEKFTYAVGQKP